MIKNSKWALSLLFFTSTSWCFCGEGLAQDRIFLWRVQSPTATVYLLGSIHFLKKEHYPLSPKIEEAFAKSGTLVVEANIQDPGRLNLPGIMERAIYRGNDTLEAHVSQETYELVRKEVEKLGLPLDLVRSQRPWFLAMELQALELMQKGFDPRFGLDNHFLSRAQGQKKIQELESLDYQIQLLSNQSDPEQEVLLLQTLKDLNRITQEADLVIGAWQRGDAKALEAVLTRSFSQDPRLAPVYESLVSQRNRNMASRLEEYLRTRETYFVVVGAGHLVGEKGITALLQKKGYRVEQL